MSTTYKTLTPFEISLLLHIYAIAEPFSNNGCPAYRDAIQRFEKEGMIKQSHLSGSGFHTTPKGTHHVHALCNLPLPVAKWITPKTLDQIAGE